MVGLLVGLGFFRDGAEGMNETQNPCSFQAIASIEKISCLYYYFPVCQFFLRFYRISCIVQAIYWSRAVKELRSV